MKRTFPGDPLDTTTRQIAAFVIDMLFPLDDVFIDLHSGGSSLDIIHSVVIEPGKTPEQHEANVRAVLAFGTPIAVVIDNRGDPRTSTASAALAGMTVIGTQKAGGGTVSLDALAVCRRGARNLLAHFGVLSSDYATPLEAESCIYELSAKAHIIAEDDGVFEPMHRLGTDVRAGELAGRIHFSPHSPVECLSISIPKSTELSIIAVSRTASAPAIAVSSLPHPMEAS